ncbi:hypothetical protein D3C73_987110 [compost metagenome]
MISKKTKRLNRSPVRKAPLTPMTSNRNRAWKRGPARSHRARAKIMEQAPSTLVRATIRVDRRSATRTMPNGAGQSPN